jgi:hypothetical protein
MCEVRDEKNDHLDRVVEELLVFTIIFTVLVMEEDIRGDH